MKRQGNILLYPLSLIFGAATGIRNYFYNSGLISGHEFNVPVICVGNITVGGTGKTPHCEYLLDLLKDKFNVALLSRGYKRKSSGFLIARPDMSSSDVGDEPLQICRKYPGIIVAVDRNRVNGVKSILKERPETDVIILDDGFQHRRIKPGFSILLTDFSRLVIHDFFLPYGDLREGVRNMFRADIILITKSPPELSAIQRRIIVKEMDKESWQNLYFTSIEYRNPQPLFAESKTICRIFIKENLERSGVILVTGIARAELFREYVGKFASELNHFSYPDHHSFTEKNIMAITDAFEKLPCENKYIITTEKDAVRLREFVNIAEPARSAMFYVPAGIFFLNDDSNEFDNLIIGYVRKNKRNDRIP